MRILVIGSSTELGAGLAQELFARGHAITLLSQDPRRVPEDWKLRFRCHYGFISNAHVLHAALEDADRIVLALPHPRLSTHADREPSQVHQILEANHKANQVPVIKLTSAGRLYESEWWVMAARRKADQLVRQDKHGHLFAVGTIGESLLRSLHRGIFWVPSGLKGRIHWIARKEAIQRLADLALRPAPPRKETILGTTRMSLEEATVHVLSRSRTGKTGLIFFPVFPWMRPLLPWLPNSLYSLERSLWNCREDDIEPETIEWRGTQDPFMEVLNAIGR
ncbi:MAG: hypothetical protein RL318_896 [Fibrobacterota bacterium]|jgi:uncharacterized protein YbjT (DUF2867 family)